VPASRPSVAAIKPLWAVEGGRVTLTGTDFPERPTVRIGDQPAQVAFASPTAIGVLVPSGLDGGRTTVKIDGVPGETVFLDYGSVLATGLHQVDNPAFDREGNLYVTYSGSRGQEVPVSVFRVRRDGTREAFVSGIVNPTSLAFDAKGDLYASSRFEGTVYRLRADGSIEPVAADLGVACGLAFAPDGRLFVGDRSGTVFVISPDGKTSTLASLPPSVAAFHLAFGPDGAVYATGPTLAPYDHLYRIDASGHVDILYSGFGRPQGLTFDSQGLLYVVEALAGSSGLYRMMPDGRPELVLAGSSLIGVAFDPLGGMVVSSNETVYRLDVSMRPASP
jgi:sugar lactone lactonase YvrE